MSKTQTMLNIIDLAVIKGIFDKAQAIKKIPASSKMVYINCLMFHFQDKPASFFNAGSFEIPFDIAKYENFKTEYNLLHAAGLISFNDKTIQFNNVWGKLIHANRYENVDIETNGVDQYIQALKSNNTMIEVTAMKNHISLPQVTKLIDLFILEQQGLKKVYRNESDCLKHCSYWIGHNKESLPDKIVKSSSKILGKTNFYD